MRIIVGRPFPEQDHAILFAATSLNRQLRSDGEVDSTGLFWASRDVDARQDIAMAAASAHLFMRLPIT